MGFEETTDRKLGSFRYIAQNGEVIEKQLTESDLPQTPDGIWIFNGTLLKTKNGEVVIIEDTDKT